MIRHQITLLLLVFFIGIIQAQSRVERDTFFSPALGVEKIALVYLPDGYDTDTAQAYPVVYFLRIEHEEWFNPNARSNGMTLKDVADELISKELIGKMILVSPSIGRGNRGMVNMLRPDLFSSSGVPFDSGQYEDYFFQDLIPHIDSTYRTLPERCARGVDGFSLGGYAATLYGVKHPGVFSSVGSFDGTLMWYDFDDPRGPGILDDFWFTNELFDPLFDQPRDLNYMKRHSAIQLLVNANSMTLDSIRDISFHIHVVPSDSVGNQSRNRQFIDSLATFGIHNSFDQLALSPEARHNFDWADVHAHASLVKHWEKFSALTCPALTTATANPIEPLTGLELFQNYPNPVRGQTTISFFLPQQTNLRLQLYDAQGRRLKTLVEGFFLKGRHQVKLDAHQFEPGIYFYQLQTSAEVLTRKLLLLE